MHVIAHDVMNEQSLFKIERMCMRMRAYHNWQNSGMVRQLHPDARGTIIRLNMLNTTKVVIVDVQCVREVQQQHLHADGKQARRLCLFFLHILQCNKEGILSLARSIMFEFSLVLQSCTIQCCLS